VGIEEFLTVALAPEAGPTLKRGRARDERPNDSAGVRPTYPICYSARAQTLSCAPNHPSVFALIFASVFTGGGPSVFEAFSVSRLFSAGLCRRADRSVFDNYGKIWE
jgi:hypothetical protein